MEHLATQEKYLNLFNSTIDGIFSLDQQLTITNWNRQMERYSGLKRENCVGRSAIELFPLLNNYQKDFQQVLRGKVVVKNGMPFNPMLNNGLEDYYEGYYTPLKDDQQEVVGLMGVVRELGMRSKKEAAFEADVQPQTSTSLNLNYNGSLEGVFLESLFDPAKLQEIQDAFARITGAASIIVDKDGRPLTSPSNFNVMADAIFHKYDKNLGYLFTTTFVKPENDQHLVIQVNPYSGLWECTINIVLNQKIIGKWLLGQVWTDHSDKDLIDLFAQKFDIKKSVLKQAKQAIPLIPQARFHQICQHLYQVSRVITEMAADNMAKEKRIIERKKIENELINLTNRREELARIINKSPAIAFLWGIDASRPVSFVSENINQLGYTQDDFLSRRMKFGDIIHKEDRGKIQNELTNYIRLKANDFFTREYRIVSKHGGIRWIQERSWVRQENEGQMKYLEGLIVDISVRKFAEEALKKSEEHFKLLFEKAPIGMTITSMEGDIVSVNASFCELLGYQNSDLMRKNLKKLIYKKDVGEIYQQDLLLLEGDRNEYQSEARYVCSNGTLLYTINKVTLIRDSQGRPIQKLAQIVDISYRKHTEDHLRESERRLQQAQSFANLGNFEINLKTRELILSEETYHILGMYKSDAEMKEEILEQMILPDFFISTKKKINDFVLGKVKYLNIKVRIRRLNDKEERTVHARAEKLFDDKGSAQKIIGIVQDITDIKATEEELKIRNQELNNFVYKVSHDLRSPLLSITGLLNLLKLNRSSDESEKYLGLIEQRIKRLDLFIQDILSHSKNLFTKINIEPINFEALISECFDELSYLENTTKIQKYINVSDKVFHSDPERLKDVFRNIICNSILYMHPSKEESHIYIEVDVTEEGVAKISFEDNGLGIEKAVLPKVFNMFYRGIEISNGAGIGLYIVKQAIEKLDGKISVDSIVSIGSRFLIHLPDLKTSGKDRIDNPVG
ncbi:MAG: PAS domain S-box protein [Candidatus Cyclobacteriaceae bacterium M3_2C_046]